MRALVMEVVEGPTLAERIQQGSIPIDEAIAIAKQMAEALEYAHERSIIHRDLKPANLKLTEEGDVKLLDFGLAKALEGDTGKAQDDSHSPTLTRVTEAGVLLGTAGYMSPEQAKGKPVDRRADIWAFGVVLFEMLTGQRLFAGETASETLAFVMTKEPSFEALPSGTPASVHELLRRCLTKDPRMRLQAIGEARVVLSEPVEEAREAPRARRPTFLPWVVAATCAAVAIVALWPRARTLEAPVRLNAELGAGLSLDWSEGTGAVLSPDGSTLAFVARESGSESSKLFVRPLEQPHATPLAGTDGADGPFFSPDGEWIGFFVGDSLRKIQVGGGGSVTLTGVSRPRGAWWGDDGVIALAPDIRTGLMKISSSGGEVEPLTELDDSELEITHRWPQILPGSRVIVFTAAAMGGDYSNANIVAMSLETGERHIVHRGGFHARYLPSGHIVYLHEATLYAAPFDPEELAITGQPIPVIEGVVSGSSGGAQFALSDNGTLVYSEGAASGKVTIQWMLHDGTFAPLRDVGANYRELQFSPGGARLALSVIGQQEDIWVYELQRGTMSRFDVPRRDGGIPEVDAGRQTHRVRFQPKPKDGRRDLLEVRRWHRGGAAIVRERARHLAGTLAFQRQVSRLHREESTGRGRLYHAGRRRRVRGTESRRATALLDGTLQRERASILARRTVHRLRVQRVRTIRSLRETLSGSRRTMADLDRWRRLSRVVTEWSRALLPQHRIGANDDGR